jgi:hypothetical protein
MTFVAMKTSTTTAQNPTVSVSAGIRPFAISPPRSGNTAQIAVSASAFGNARRESTAVSTAVLVPIAIAGAGPSSVIARTVDRNAPERRIPCISTIITSLTTASANRTRRSAIGCQSALVEVSTAVAIAAVSAAIRVA